MSVTSLVFGMCPWCLTEVRSDGLGGMEPVEQRTKNGPLGWWHQGCIADLAASDSEWSLDE
jgi:hypothetical protein